MAKKRTRGKRRTKAKRGGLNVRKMLKRVTRRRRRH